MRHLLLAVAVVVAVLALPTALDAQTKLWDIDKRALFPDSLTGLDIYAGDTINLDNDPGTRDFIVVDFGSGTWHQGHFQVVVERLSTGLRCYGGWFKADVPIGFNWYKFENHGGVTRLIVQNSWVGERHIGIALNAPRCGQ